jgi:hypothetical protein
MKKLLLSAFLLLGVFASHAQSDYYPALTSDGSTSGNGRAPQGKKNCDRSVYLITASELQAQGYAANDVINAIAFNYLAAQNIATTSTSFTLYMQNSTDATNLKDTPWATAITGMTTVSTDNITIPASTGLFYIPFSGTNSFTYTGGSVYIAFDYQNTGTVATTGNVAACNSTGLTGGIKTYTGTTVGTALTTSSFRPQTNFGIKVSCARPLSQGFTNVTATSVDLTWTGSGSNFDLEYGADGYTQGSGTTVSNISGTTKTISGLTASTVYNFYVRTNCGGGASSVWKGPYPFYATFAPTSPTYTTSFETYDFPFLGWLADAAANGTSWSIADVGTGNALAQDGSSSIFSYNSTVAAASSRVYSRGINLVAGSDATITYYVNNDISSTSTGSANYQLTVGTDQTAATQTTVIADESGLTNTTYESKSYTFKPTTTGVYYFSFLNNSAKEPTASQYHGIFVDNFTVSQTLSTSQFLSSKFNVNPNPAKDIVNITNTENMFVNAVNFTDLNGRIVKSLSFDKISNVQINVSDLSTGVYMMNIFSDKGTATKKIIKN